MKSLSIWCINRLSHREPSCHAIVRISISIFNSLSFYSSVISKRLVNLTEYNWFQSILSFECKCKMQNEPKQNEMMNNKASKTTTTKPCKSIHIIIYLFAIKSIVLQLIPLNLPQIIMQQLGERNISSVSLSYCHLMRIRDSFFLSKFLGSYSFRFPFASFCFCAALWSREQSICYGTLCCTEENHFGEEKTTKSELHNKTVLHFYK